MRCIDAVILAHHARYVTGEPMNGVGEHELAQRRPPVPAAFSPRLRAGLFLWWLVMTYGALWGLYVACCVTPWWLVAFSPVGSKQPTADIIQFPVHRIVECHAK